MAPTQISDQNPNSMLRGPNDTLFHFISQPFPSIPKLPPFTNHSKTLSEHCIPNGKFENRRKTLHELHYTKSPNCPIHSSSPASFLSTKIFKIPRSHFHRIQNLPSKKYPKPSIATLYLNPSSFFLHHQVTPTQQKPTTTLFLSIPLFPKTFISKTTKRYACDSRGATSSIEPRQVLHVPNPIPSDMGNVQESRSFLLDRGGGGPLR